MLLDSISTKKEKVKNGIYSYELYNRYTTRVKHLYFPLDGINNCPIGNESTARCAMIF